MIIDISTEEKKQEILELFKSLVTRKTFSLIMAFVGILVMVFILIKLPKRLVLISLITKRRKK